MNNKDFFKQVLENEMPDLENVRKNCLNTDTHQKKSFFLTILKSDLVLKRIIPAAACLLIVVLSVAAIYTSQNPDNYIVSNKGEFTGDNFSDKKMPSAKKSKEEKSKSDTDKSQDYYNNEYFNKTNKNNNSHDNETITDKDGRTLKSSFFLKKPDLIKNSYKFNSISDLKAFPEKCFYDNGYVIIDDDKEDYILDIPYSNLSMLIEDKTVYSFNLNGETMSENGILSKDAADSLTGCRFSVNYETVYYEIGYTTYKYSNESSYDEEFENKNGNIVKISNDNHFSMNIDGYYFYVTASSDDLSVTKDFVNNLTFTAESIN